MKKKNTFSMYVVNSKGEQTYIFKNIDQQTIKALLVMLSSMPPLK